MADRAIRMARSLAAGTVVSKAVSGIVCAGRSGIFVLMRMPMLMVPGVSLHRARRLVPAIDAHNRPCGLQGQPGEEEKDQKTAHDGAF